MFLGVQRVPFGQEGAAGAWFGCGPVLFGGPFLVWRAQPLAQGSHGHGSAGSAADLGRTASHGASVNGHFTTSLSHLLLISA